MRQNHNFIAFFLFVGVWLLFYIYTGLISTPPLHPHFDSYSLVLKYRLSDASFLQDVAHRHAEVLHLAFAPYTNSFQIIIGKYVQSNPYLMYSLWSMFFSIFNFFTFLFLKKLGLTPKMAFLLSILTVIGRQGTLLWEINTMESFGLPFLSLSLYLTVLYVQKQKIILGILLIISLFILSMSKESYILILPAIAFFVLHYAYSLEKNIPQILKKHGWVFITVLLISFTEIIYLITNMGTTAEWRGGKVGFSLDTPLLSYLQALVSLFQENYYYLYFGLIGAIFYFSKVKTRKIIASPLVALSIMIIISQWLLYSSVGFQNRYLMPIMIGVVFLLGASWQIMRESNLQKEAKYLGVLLIIPIMVQLAPKITEDPTQLFRATRHAISQMDLTDKILKEVNQNSDKQDITLIVYNEDFQFLNAGVLTNYFVNLYERKNIHGFSLESTDIKHSKRTSKFKSKPSEKIIKNAKNIIVLIRQEPLFLDKMENKIDLKNYTRKVFGEFEFYVLYTKK